MLERRRPRSSPFIHHHAEAAIHVFILTRDGQMTFNVNVELPEEKQTNRSVLYTSKYEILLSEDRREMKNIHFTI